MFLPRQPSFGFLGHSPQQIWVSFNKTCNTEWTQTLHQFFLNCEKINYPLTHCQLSQCYFSQFRAWLGLLASKIQTQAAFLHWQEQRGKNSWGLIVTAQFTAVISTQLLFYKKKKGGKGDETKEKQFLSVCFFQVFITNAYLSKVLYQIKHLSACITHWIPWWFVSNQVCCHDCLHPHGVFINLRWVSN